MDQDNNSDGSLDSLLDQLKKSQSVKDMIKKEEEQSGPMTEDDISAFVMKNTALLIKKSVEAVGDLKDAAVAGGDAEDISALAELINASTAALAELNKISLQNKKAKTSKEIAQMQITAKKEVPQIQQNNNIFFANREEMMKQIFAKADIKEIEKDIDI